MKMNRIQAAEQGRQDLGKGGLQNGSGQNGSQGYNADHTDDNDQCGDDGGGGDGDGRDHFALFRVGRNIVLLQGIQGAGQLQIGNVTGNEA